MVLLILLLIAIVLQIVAAAVAIRLTRTTKYNSSWILITVALVLMCIMRYNEFAQQLSEVTDGRTQFFVLPRMIYVWIGVGTSLCFAVAVLLIKKVLNYLALREEQRRHHEKRILSAVLRAEENQRRVISKELHDGLGPLLSSAKMGLSAMEALGEGGSLSGKQREILANTDYVIAEALKSLREVSNNLSPHVLENFGLARALRIFIEKLQPSTPVKIEFTTNMTDVRLAPEKEVALYRVLCELVNNTLRHAQATLLTIDMQLAGGMVTLLYADNGRGYDTEKESEGMGSWNMTSRIASVKGEMSVASRRAGRHKGTRVTIKMDAGQQ